MKKKICDDIITNKEEAQKCVKEVMIRIGEDQSTELVINKL